MRKGLILGFVGNNPKHARRLPDDAVGQLIRGNVPLGYRTVLTGIEGNFEMGCAAAALRLRGEGLKIKLHIAVTRGKYKTYLRYKRDNLRLSEAHRIIEQADNVEKLSRGKLRWKPKGSATAMSSIRAICCSIILRSCATISETNSYPIIWNSSTRGKMSATCRTRAAGRSWQRKPAYAICGNGIWLSWRIVLIKSTCRTGLRLTRTN